MGEGVSGTRNHLYAHPCGAKWIAWRLHNPNPTPAAVHHSAASPSLTSELWMILGWPMLHHVTMRAADNHAGWYDCM